MNEYKLEIAELIVRVFAGILFLLQGYDKIFKIKMAGVISTFTADADKQNIPRIFVNAIAYYTSFAEFFGGLLLILGLFTNYALYFLGLDLLLVCFAFSYMQPIWDMKHVFPRLLLVITLLLMPNEFNKLSLDHLFNLNETHL